MDDQRRVILLDRLRMSDLAQVGGKNASLGEMIGHLAANGVRVPGGLATTAFAFRELLQTGGLKSRIEKTLAGLDIDDVAALARVGAELRSWIIATPLADTRPPCSSDASERLIFSLSSKPALAALPITCCKNQAS